LHLIAKFVSLISFKNLVFSIVYSNIYLLVTKDAILILQFLIFLIMLMYSCVYLNLTFLYNLAYKVKSSIIFFRILNSAIVYLLIFSCSIVAFNNNSNNSLFNILLNFFVFITF